MDYLSLINFLIKLKCPGLLRFRVKPYALLAGLAATKFFSDKS